MPNIRCTQKLLKELNEKPVDVEYNKPVLGDWHANLLLINRRKCILFTNDKTLYTFIIAGVTKPNLKYLKDLFRQHLFKQLLYEGFSQSAFEPVLEEIETINYAKTNSRSALGSMNNHVRAFEYHIYNAGYDNLNFFELNKIINRMPMSAIKYKYSIDLLEEALGEKLK